MTKKKELLKVWRVGGYSDEVHPLRFGFKFISIPEVKDTIIPRREAISLYGLIDITFDDIKNIKIPRINLRNINAKTHPFKDLFSFAILSK